MNLLEIGDVICGRFSVERFLARGTMGEGYLCHDSLLAETVVCKIALSSEIAALEEFRAQYRKLFRIRSLGVARVLGYFEHERRPLILLEWIDGIDLNKWSEGRALNERLNALADIAEAVRDLHAEGITHGDLWGGVNVVAGSKRGCVLIDPEPEMWGSTSSSGSIERRADIESIVFLIERLAPEYLGNVLASLVRELRTAAKDLILEVVAGQLRSVAREVPLVAGLDTSVAAAGAAFKASLVTINRCYQRNRTARRTAIAGLADRIADLSQAFGLEFIVHGVDEHLEEGRDERGQGYFLTRYIECRSPLGGGAGWLITFEEVRDFLRPYPYSGGTIAQGDWEVNGVRTARGRIRLNIAEDGATQFLVTEGEQPHSFGRVDIIRAKLDYLNTEEIENEELRSLDDAWLLARISDLTGVPLVRTE